MADFNFTSNTASNLDDLNAILSMNPNLFGEESTNDNEGTTSQPEEGVTGDAPVGNIQQFFQEDVSFNPNVGLELETNQVATNLPGIEDEDWWKLTNEEEDEAFHRLMEMTLEDFEEMMRVFPGEAADPSPANPYATSSKRARHDEEELAQTTAESAPLASQPSFEPQQIRQIRQIREAKSRRGKVIEALQARAQGLEVDLAKSRAEVSDAYENGRMVTLLGLNGEWEAKEAKIKADAEIEHHRQVGAIRTFLEGQIAEGKSREENLEREANFALAQQLEEANRQLDEKDKKLAQFRAEAEAYKTNVEGEARRYKQAAEEGMRVQKKDLEAAESARTLVESHLSEKTRALALAKPYVEGLEQKVADLERLDGAQGRAEIARADQQQQKLLEESQSYAKDLEKKLAKLEKERTYQEAAQRRQEEELARSGTEACKALEGRIKDLEAAAEEATRAKESFTQANKDLNEELRSISGDLDKVQMALQTKTDELEKARSTIEEQVNAQKLQERRETRSVFGPMEQINVEPSGPARVKMPSAVQTFTFAAAKGLPPPLIERRQIHAKKSRRQLQHGPQPEPESQTRSKQEQEQEQEPTPTFSSQLGMFSHHFHSPVTTNRPRRSHIHAEEAIRNRFRIPLGQVHTIVSKLDQVGDWQDGMAEKAGLIISAELTGLTIHDLKVMQGLRMSIPGSSPNPQNIMSAAQLEIPRTLVDLLASNNRPAIRAFLDGASFPQSQGSGNVVRETESRGTQTKAYAVEVEGDIGNTAGQGEVAVVLPKPKQTCGGPRSGFASLRKMMIFLYLLYLILPLLLPLPWSSPAAWLFEDPDPNSGWLDYVPEPSPWSNLLHDISGWPLISKFLDIFFDLPDLESKWCGNIPIG